MDLFTIFMLLLCLPLGLAVVCRLAWPGRVEVRERYHGVVFLMSPVGDGWAWQVDTLKCIGVAPTRWQAMRDIRRVIEASEYAYRRRSLPIRVAATAA